MRVTVYTAVLGQTDPLRPPDVVDPDARYLCFTDHAAVPAPYERVAVPTSDRPQYESRRIKILADHPWLTGADCLLWHDASYRLLTDVTWVPQALQHADLAAMRHPRRRSIEAEAPRIARYGYLPLEQAYALCQRYRAEGFLAQTLTSAGLLARRVSPTVRRFGEIWWAEVQHWGGRDQGSVDYAMWRAGATVRYLPGAVKTNSYAGFRGAPAPAAVA